MPSTENATLQRIQQEIKESVEREEELRNGYVLLNTYNFTAINNNNRTNGFTNGFASKPTLQRAQSTSTINTDVHTNGNATRRFTPNPTAKGVMHRFIKSRGKITPSPLQPSTKQSDALEPLKTNLEPSKRVRNNFVPVEERMRQELQEYSVRERELRNERRKSQPDLMALLVQSPEPRRALRPARSLAQLYGPEDVPEETVSAPSSLKPARSLAELCDTEGDEMGTPGTHSLILQFENLKKQREQNRA